MLKFVKQRVFKIMPELQKITDRTPIAREWLRNARKLQDAGQVFSAYFSAYIALVVCATQILGDSGKVATGDDEHWEREAIEYVMNFKSAEIAAFLDTDNGVRIKQAVWLREIPENKNLRIIGHGNDTILQQAAKNLSAYFGPLRKSSLSPNEVLNQAQDLSTVFRKVRNRLFHGGKTYDPEGDDGELLNKLNPLLIEIVEILQKH